jgi:hypothetical protein
MEDPCTLWGGVFLFNVCIVFFLLKCHPQK